RQRGHERLRIAHLPREICAQFSVRPRTAGVSASKPDERSVEQTRAREVVGLTLLDHLPGELERFVPEAALERRVGKIRAKPTLRQGKTHAFCVAEAFSSKPLCPLELSVIVEQDGAEIEIRAGQERGVGLEPELETAFEVGDAALVVASVGACYSPGVEKVADQLVGADLFGHRDRFLDECEPGLRAPGEHEETPHLTHDVRLLAARGQRLDDGCRPFEMRERAIAVASLPDRLPVLDLRLGSRSRVDVAKHRRSAGQLLLALAGYHLARSAVAVVQMGYVRRFWVQCRGPDGTRTPSRLRPMHAAPGGSAPSARARATAPPPPRRERRRAVTRCRARTPSRPPTPPARETSRPAGARRAWPR